MTNTIPVFRVGIQLADNAGESDFGTIKYTNWANAASSWSGWAGDSNNYDPDAIRVFFETYGSTLSNRDVRLSIQAADNRGRSEFGPVQYTPWASQGGGWSAIAFDMNQYDPDVFRIKLDTRPWNSSKILKNLRSGIQVFDSKGAQAGQPVYTPWSSQGGGFSAWALDDNGYDPDGARIVLESILE